MGNKILKMLLKIENVSKKNNFCAICYHNFIISMVGYGNNACMNDGNNETKCHQILDELDKLS